ncbi:MAG: PAS domain S-box protein, partial [Betaproteobacteria bacterium]
LPHFVPRLYPLIADFFDLPRFLTFAVAALAVGWGTTFRRRAEAALRRSELELRDAGSELEAKVAGRTAELRCSEERYARALDASNDGLWEWNPLTDELFISPRARQLFGVPDDVEIRTRADLKAHGGFHPEDRPHIDKAFSECLATGSGGIDIEYRVTNPAGELSWVRSRGKVFLGSHGQPTLITGALTNITERKRAQAALSLSKERYARAMEAAEEGHWEWNVQTDEMFLSTRMKEILGFASDARFTSRADFFARQPIHPDDRQRVDEAREASLAGTTPRYEIEYRVSPRPGEVRWVRSRGKVFHDDDERPLRISGSLSDITDRKLADEALRCSEERYALAVEASGEGHWDWNIATDEYYCSPRMLELYGFPPGTTFKGRDDFLAQFPFHPEDRPRWEEAVAAHFAGKTVRFDIEIRMVPRGETRWIHLTGLLTRDSSGKPVRWTGAVADITERRCTEDALRLSEQRYALAMEATGDGHWDWNIPADKMYVSPLLLEMCGLPADSVFANRSEWVERFPFYPGERPRYAQAIADHFAGKTDRVDMEIRIVPHGETHWVHMTGRCSRDTSGTPIRWAGSMTDVTARRLAEEELQRMEHQLRQAQRFEAMGTLAGGIAHDFNNLLGAILGYGEMALRDVPEGSRLRRDVESMMIAGERGRALVDRILAFSRSGVGERVAVHVEEVMRETLALLSARLPRGILIEERLNAGRAAVMGDATQIHQVLMNLVTNAVQAMPSGGTLLVSLDRVSVHAPRAAVTGTIAARDYVVLEVADTGSGIRSEILEKIFDPFFTTKEVGVGTGLGLSLVHGIVTGLGGLIDVATVVGKGSVFSVYLPRAGDVTTPSQLEKRAEPETRRGGHERVLVVDDEESLVRLATETLTELGYTAVGFTASTTALEAFLADPAQFDAVITDESMPGTSGSELIRRMRAVRPTMPIVLVSGYLSPTVVRRAREAGATEVRKKPLSARELAAALDAALRAAQGPRIEDVALPTLSDRAAEQRRPVTAADSRARPTRR